MFCSDLTLNQRPGIFYLIIRVFDSSLRIGMTILVGPDGLKVWYRSVLVSPGMWLFGAPGVY